VPARSAQKDGARILCIDIETFPMLFYAWQPWEARALKVVENTSMASWSAKWLHGPQITRCLADYKGYKPGSRDDKKLCAELWPLLDEADIVVAHNADRFDVKKINYRFMIHNLGIPSPYKTVDTLKEVKRISGHDENRLNELCRQHGIGQKLRTGGAELWFDCLGGKPAAWARMKRYNARDVFPLLEKWYLFLRPWITTHPNLGTYSGVASCPKCGSVKVQSRGVQRTATRAYQRMQCQACGGWSRGTESIEGRASLVNVPR
jgi:hypothetical protein